MKKRERKPNKHSPFKMYLWMLSFLKKYWPLALCYLFLDFLVNAVNLSIPKFIQYFIDHTLPSEDLSHLTIFIGVLILFVVVRIISEGINNLIQRHLTEKTLRDIQFSMFSKLRKLGFSYYEKNNAGTTLAMFTTELEAIINIYRRYLPSAIRMSIMVVISLILVIQINVWLSLVLIPSFLLYYIFGAYFAKKAAITGRGVRDTHRQVFTKIYDSLSGMAELRVTNKQNWNFTRIVDVFEKYRKQYTREMVWLQCRGTVRKSLIHFGLFAVFIIGIILVRNEQITVGEFVAFVFYYDIVISRLTTLITNLTEQRVLMYQVEKVYDMFAEKPDVEESNEVIELANVQGSMELKNVHFYYQVQKPILSGINLKINAGQRVAIVGTSGNGKSTMLKLLGRFYDVQEGEIALDQVDIRKLSFHQLRHNMGFVFQETYLFGDTIMENIRFGNPKATDEEVIQAAKAAYAHDFIMESSAGYLTQVGERGIKLSGGQKQRIAIARMFIKNPKVILLDEATSALDTLSEREVQRALDNLLIGRTTITVAHRLSTIQHYDKIVVLENGQIKEAGTYDELMSHKGSFYHLAKGGDEHESTKMAN